MLVRLTDAWRDILQRRAANSATGPYPAPVRALLGEMAAAAVLMESNIKFNGALVLQVFGDGPVKLAVVEVQPDLSLRATATVRGTVAEDATLGQMLNVEGGGRCAITLDPKDKSAGQQPLPGRGAARGCALPQLCKHVGRAAALHAAVRAARHRTGAGRQ